ncbi:D-inositol 3-phosphate glycosyltransferase [bacterium BMS3Bbin06]|nr:D-inositol 3-phosphate glycosyltransferase [bacterium BMS3Bbin06]
MNNPESCSNIGLKSPLSIGLLGPVYPYRGGIAQHTTMLHRELNIRCRLLTVSFKRQYPAWLYPGRSDLDMKYIGYKEPGVSYIMDSLNPVTWLKTCRLFVEHSTKAVIMPWWTVFWAVCFGSVIKRLHQRNIKVLFLCHNVMDHESSAWKAILASRVLSRVQNFLVHTKNDAEKLKAINPEAEIIVHPHPVYNHFPVINERPTRRARLELLFFGFVRPYKGVDILLKTMELIKGEDVFLTIAGEWWGSDKAVRKVLHESAVSNKVEVIDRYLSEHETAELFSRTDVVVLPYTNATVTGVIPLAYHYGKPVIVSDVGGLSDQVEDGVTGRLVRPEDPYALAEVIREFLLNPALIPEDSIRRFVSGMTWESLSLSIINFLEVLSEDEAGN